MAEKTGDALTRLDELDAVSTAAGAGSNEVLERSSESETGGREFASTGADVPEETEQIKAQIEETRNQMGETIDAIQDRLSFANISEQVSETVSHAIETAKDTAYDATIGKAVNFMKNVGDGVTHSGAIKTIRSNPVPLALIGLGTGWLVYQSLNKKSSARRGNGPDSKPVYGDAGNGKTEHSTFDTAKRSLTGVTSRAYDGIAHKANTAIESVSGAAETAYDSVTGAVGQAYEGAGEIAHRAYERAGEFRNVAHEKYDEYLEEKPLALGAVALAIGAAVGFAIPSTEFEGRLMGDARENLMERAQAAAGSAIEKAKHFAAEAGQTIKDETTRSLGH